MKQNNPSHVLAYQRPIPHQQSLPNPVIATLLHLPGTCCWIILFSAIIGVQNWLRLPSIQFVLVLWGLAVATAIASFVLYLPDRIAKPWYVFINLFVNVCGIIFTLFPGSALLFMIFSFCLGC